MANLAVHVTDLEKKFGSFVAVNKISLTVPAGMIYGFIGPNGAGKSTTIRMLCGILEPSSGQGRVGGFDLYTQTEKIKANIGYMSQKFSLYQELTVEENLNFFSGIYCVPPNEIEDRKNWVIAMAGLADHRNSLTRILSGGWKQKLALGCAILHRPPIVFLDEPTSGVDPISRRQFWDLIYSLSDEGVTIFVTTHYMDEAEYCDKIGLIFQGKLIASGSPEELKRTMMQGSVLEILTDSPYEVLHLLEKMDAVREAALFGKGVHAVIENEKAVEVVERQLKNTQIAFSNISLVKPSLEDVFVSLAKSYGAKAS